MQVPAVEGVGEREIPVQSHQRVQVEQKRRRGVQHDNVGQELFGEIAVHEMPEDERPKGDTTSLDADLPS